METQVETAACRNNKSSSESIKSPTKQLISRFNTTNKTVNSSVAQVISVWFCLKRLFEAMINFAVKRAKSNEGSDQQMEQTRGALLGRPEGAGSSTSSHHYHYRHRHCHHRRRHHLCHRHHHHSSE